jgi:hypothetical protein
MVLTSMGEGRIERAYKVGRSSQPVRARRLFAKGGLEAVLADAERPGDDFVRRRRIEAALKLDTALPAAAQDRLIAASAGLGGAFERRETLTAVARLSLAEPQQLAWLKVAGDIDGDFERREALGSLAPRLLTSPAVLAAWSQAVGRIGGDFELRSALETQVDATPQPAVLAAALQAAGRLQGDFEKREALGAIARRLQGDEAELVDAYARVAGSIGGGFEKREALNQLLDQPRLGGAGLERVLASAEGMEAGFERQQLLLRVVDKMAQAKPADAGLVERVRRAGRGLGDHERGQLENALDRLG